MLHVTLFLVKNHRGRWLVVPQNHLLQLLSSTTPHSTTSCHVTCLLSFNTRDNCVEHSHASNSQTCSSTHFNVFYYSSVFLCSFSTTRSIINTIIQICFLHALIHFSILPALWFTSSPSFFAQFQGCSNWWADQFELSELDHEYPFQMRRQVKLNFLRPKLSAFWFCCMVACMINEFLDRCGKQSEPMLLPCLFQKKHGSS